MLQNLKKFSDAPLKKAFTHFSGKKKSQNRTKLFNLWNIQSISQASGSLAIKPFINFCSWMLIGLKHIIMSYQARKSE